MKNKLLLCLVIFLHELSGGTSIPFFGPFRRTTPKPSPPPLPPKIMPGQRDQRIINADHGGIGMASPTASASFAGGNFAPAPWIPGARDQYILDQLVILHPDSPLNRDAWRESGLLNFEYNHHPKTLPTTESSVPPSSPPSSSSPLPLPPTPTTTPRYRKVHRKSKQQDITLQQQDEPNPTKSVNGLPLPGGNSSPLTDPKVSPNTGGLFDLHQTPTPAAPAPQPYFIRDLNHVQESEDAPVLTQGEPVILHGNSLFYPVPSPIFPYQPRGSPPSSQPLPPEGVIQLLKSPEQELSPYYTRPQVKLPFPLSHDCSSGSGSKPLQFVVLPIVEPVAPLKPLIPKPSWLSSQYGQFPYIPPFNLFQKPPPQPSPDTGSSSGQFVPILNRPAPPLPFVFVQSLPLELIGQNTEMDVIHAPASSTNSETKVIKDIPTPSPPSPPAFSKLPPIQNSSPPENLPSVSGPLPLIVIEKVKTPGQPPSSPLAPGAQVVEISKQSIQKNSNGQSAPHSTISVVQPISSGPTSLQKQQEIHKAIQKLVPVAAAVLENVELEQQKNREGTSSNNPPVPPSPLVGSNPAQNPPPIDPSSGKVKDQDISPLRAPLRPEQDQSQPPFDDSARSPSHKKPDSSSSEEAITGGINSPTIVGDVVTEA